MRNLLIACCLLVSNVTEAVSQELEQASGTDELLQGLLELVPEPSSKTSAPIPAAQSILLKPADVGLTDTDLETAGQSPLESIRQSMLISAGLLRRGINDDLLTIQDDILNRLDDLIGQLEPEKQSPNTSKKEDTHSPCDEEPAGEQSQQQQDERQTQSKDGQQASVGSRASTDQPQSSDSNERLTGSPSNIGPKRSVEVRLNAREAYQEKVWGQLPERVRASMQSKMVEEFLPSHREQIENYYRRLMERYRENDGKR